ncbi:MAG: cobalamin-dependent protein [Deferrisomatales bacterium]|nr:cobalamin-dependent protein [Deferrisomatales bacterium]
MATILLWNSLTTRRRSASDTFLDNGLGVLQAHLQQHGHRVQVEDWATDPFFASLAVPAIARPLRRLYGHLLGRAPGSSANAWHKVCGATALGLQWLQDRIQQARLRRRLRDLAWRVAEEGIPVVGIKLWYGEAFTWAKYLARCLRDVAPDTLIVVGGYHATLYEEDILRDTPFDLAIRGEGEYALCKVLDLADEWAGRGNQSLLRAIADKRFENAVWREGDEIRKGRKRPVRISQKAIPTYGAAPGKVRIHVMLESLGCSWGKCSFCVHPHFYNKYVQRAVDDVVTEMQALVDQDIGIFRFAGSDTPPVFGAKIAQGILDAGLNVMYGMGSRAVQGCAHAAAFDRTVGQYETLLRSGLRSVFIGGETGHDVINKTVMNKGVTRADLVATARAIRQAEANTGLKLDLILALIYPVPLVDGVEQQDVFDANVALLREFRPDSVMVTPPGPFKHSEWFSAKDTYGFTLNDDFVRSAMEYEYVLYKPPSMWPELKIGLQGTSFVELLEECGRFRKAVEAMGIPTDLSDEHFLMLRAAGYRGREGAEEFKRETLLDIISCDYATLRGITARINKYTSQVADQVAACPEKGFATGGND